MPFHKAFYVLWHFVQPILGGVIGADIDFRNWAISRFGLYLACVLMGISVSYVEQDMRNELALKTRIEN